MTLSLLKSTGNIEITYLGILEWREAGPVDGRLALGRQQLVAAGEVAATQEPPAVSLVKTGNLQAQQEFRTPVPVVSVAAPELEKP